MNTKIETIVYFDGVCYLCNSAVNFLIKIDKGKRVKFAPLQSNFAVNELKRSSLNSAEIDSIIVQKGGQFYIRSNAVTGIIKELRWYWRIFLIVNILPLKIRDKLYDFVANRRYNWFGRKDKCMVPSDEVKSRFITD